MFAKKTFTLCASLLAFSLTTLHLAALSVEEKRVGPTNEGGVYLFSPQGGRVAYLGLKGTQAYVSIDGESSPLFDELICIRGQSFYYPQKAIAVISDSGGMAGSATSVVIFSADGAHYAYAARQGADYVVVHDGKVVGKGPFAKLALAAGPLTLSPTGAQVYWHEVEELSGGQQRWRVVMTGKPAAWSGQQTMLPVFSGDDSRYAVVGGKVGDYQSPVLIVDGKEASYAGVKPVFTADGSVLLSTMREGNGSVLLSNGKSVTTCVEVEKFVSAPAGKRWGAIVRTKVVNGMAVSMLFIDGKEVSGTEGAQNVWFSPDGKRNAATVVDVASRSGAVIIDGKRGKSYPNVPQDRVYWTADNSLCLYFAAAGGRSILVVETEEQPIERILGSNYLTFAAIGKRYGYATADGMNQNYTLVIDGKNVLPASVYPLSGTLAFSRDGRSHGYVVAAIGRSDASGVVINGEMRRDIAVRPFAKWYQMETTVTSIVFSTDGAHYAYLGQTAAPRSGGLYVSGKLAYRSTAPVFFPTFTPDSKHLLWVAQEPSKVQGQPAPHVVFLDGKEAVRANGGFFMNAPGVFSMDKEGTATYFAADGDFAKRYRIRADDNSDISGAASRLAQIDAAANAEAEAARVKEAQAVAAAAKQRAEAEAKAKADYEAAIEARQQARQEALDAKKKAREDALKRK